MSLCPPTLVGNDVQKKRQEILEYFHNSFTLFEKLFELFTDNAVFYKKSEPTRHPMIFYYGHTAVFFINKLILMKIIDTRINPEFESIFAVGVDEMQWDDLDKKKYVWPSVQEVKEYRRCVRELVGNLIETVEFSLPITQESALWIILMGIEHERIHIETSSVLHRQLPIEDITDKQHHFPLYPDFSRLNYPQNELLHIPAASVKLGKSRDDIWYGWDNEYGEKEVTLKEFFIAKYLVSNGEYLEFVQEGGYENKALWTQEGWKYIQKSKVKHPVFWVKQEDDYLYRTLTTVMPMPLDWPVDVNAYEAEAFCRYKSLKEGKNYSLPSEAEFMAVYNMSDLDTVTCKEHKANQNFIYASACSVNRYKFVLDNGTEIYDISGNVWQWSKTPIHPFEGFEPHEAYDDFSIPTFDAQHALIMGASWASTGNLMMKHSRYAFRKHFYQHSGFRYVLSNNKEEKTDMYETDELVSQYCEFQYGKEYFGVKNFALSCVKTAKKYMQNTTKALDLGCATGRASFELAKIFDAVDGVDFSTRFIGVASKLQKEGSIGYTLKEEGDIASHKRVSLKDFGCEHSAQKVSFWQGDACNLKPYIQGYDLVLATNLIDRLYNPKLFLEDIASRMNDEGVLILTSPYTWQEESTKKEFWLGGFYDEDGKPVYTIDTLHKILEAEFEYLGSEDIEFVIRETKRKYQHTVSHATIWRKKDV